MSLLAVACVLVLVCVSIWFVLGRKKHAIDTLPGPPTLPFLGNALEFNTSADEILATYRRLYATYGLLYRTWFLHIPVIHPQDPKDIEVILSSSQHISKSHEYDFVHNWLGTGLLTSTGAKWHKHRKMLTPAFHFKILEEFVPVFNENVNIFISKLREYVGKKEGFDIVPLVTHCALDIICETAMGTKINAQKNEDSEYVTALLELNESIAHRAYRPWLYPSFIFNLTWRGQRQKQLIKFLHNYTSQVIYKRDAERKQSQTTNGETNEDEGLLGKRKKFAFLDLLLRIREEEGGLTHEEIRQEVDTFMFEGHDTTAMAMSWTLLFLGCNDHVQEKCLEELTEIFGDSDRSPTWTDLGSMKYLERVIKESLRMRPSVYAIGRKLDTTLKLGNEEYPAGTEVNFHIESVHRNPEIYPEPEKFDPDRFLPENCIGRHPYAYIPFSAGPRNCIGQKFAMLEMKSLLSTVLRNFRLKSCNPERDCTEEPDLILRPKYGLQMTLESRK